MAVSPGPASTVLRFLRGGCGGCLCGRLCEPCRTGQDCEPTEATVERVTPGRVILTDGRVFPTPGGSAPRPGERVTVDCRPGVIASTPAHVPRRRDDEGTPFVSSTPSFDTPQRPGWQHLPSAEDGTFGGTGGGPWEAVMVLDDGQDIEIGSDSVVDHQGRTVRWIDYVHGGSQTTYQSASLLLPDQLISGSNGAVFFKEYQGKDGVYGTEVGLATTTRTLHVQPYDPATSPDRTPVTSSGPVTGDLLRLIGDYVSHTGYVGEGGRLYATYREQDEAKRYPITPEGVLYPYTGQSTYLVEHRQGAPAGPPGRPSWVSPDGEIVVNAGWRRDHALLEDSTGAPVTLTASGHALSGGSWAACCGPVGETGPEAWMLHELGGTVTRVTPDGETETLSREVFEREVLRAPPGSFRRFSAVGTVSNSWPPQWALCEVGVGRLTEVRAVGLHDPWRDSVRGKAPKDQPAWWFWPGRPTRRPVRLPTSAPVAPLRLALTDVYGTADSGGGEGSG